MSKLGVVEDTLFVPMLGRLYASEYCPPLNGPSQFVCIFHADPCSGNVLVHIGNGKRHLGYGCLCKTIDSQCSFYSLQFFLRCRKADPHLRLGMRTMASMLYFNGVDSVSISKRLGHAQVSTTANIYAHVLEGADQRNADILSEMFLKKA